MSEQDKAGSPDTEEISEAEMNALFARAAADPATARALRYLRTQGINAVRALMKDVEASLAALEPPRAVTATGAGIRTLAGQARERETAARDRRELASELVLGALINIDNPDWDPLDPSTSKTTGAAELALLFPPAAPAASGGR